MKSKIFLTLMFCLALTITAKETNNLKDGFTFGNPEMKSIKTIAFGPENILFIGDNDGMMVYAIDIKEEIGKLSMTLNIDNIDAKIAAAMGASSSEIKILDMAVNPTSNNVFFAVRKEQGKKTHSALFRLSSEGLKEYPLDQVNYSKIAIEDAPEADAIIFRDWKSRRFTITDMHYVNGEVLISGLSNEEFSSSLRRVSFPFNKNMVTTNVQVYHVTHKENETQSPIVRFLPKQFGNEWHIIAGYACTPLVTFNLNQLNGDKKLVGKTIAEIGAGNLPLGIISYNYKGVDHVLVGNSRYSITKFTGDEIFNAKALKFPSKEKGIKRESVSIGSIAHMSNYNKKHILVIIENKEEKTFDLKMISKEDI